MLRLLLVEDEKNLRVHMLGGVPWERLGICAVQGAAGSDEAYAAFETFQPDILLTDIRIPGENGIEMARRMLSKKLDLRVIFMSAYSDADYLRSALQMRSGGLSVQARAARRFGGGAQAGHRQPGSPPKRTGSPAVGGKSCRRPAAIAAHARAFG